MAYETATKLTNKPFRRLVRLLSLDRQEIFYIYAYAIFSGLLSLTLPLGIQAILNFAQANEPTTSWWLLIVIVSLGTALVGALQIMQLSLSERLQQNLFVRASFEFAYRLPRIRSSVKEKYYPPELVNRFFDVLNLQKGIPKLLIDFSTASLQIFFGLVLLSFYHPFFILFGLTLVLLLYIIFRWTGARGLKTSLAESSYKYEVVYWLEEVARAFTSFKLAGDMKLALKKTDTLAENYIKARKEHFKILILQFANLVGFKTLVTGGLLLIGGILLIDREINLGQFVASEIIILTVINSVEKIIREAETIYDVLTAVEKIGKVTDLPLERSEGISFEQINTHKGLAVKTNEIAFKDLSGRAYALDHINLDIKPGDKIGLIGSSGSGKSILLSVLSGLEDLDAGSLMYNDVPYQNLDPISTRRNIGDCLTQKTLFHGSILENITMGREEIELKTVRWALRKVDLFSYVQQLPKGWDTELLPGAPNFPDKMVKKLILARCLAKRPQLLVVDDFFSGWESSERRTIIDAITCPELHTVISATHAREYLQRCDKVVWLEQGQIRQIGTYEELSKTEANERFFE